MTHYHLQEDLLMFEYLNEHGCSENDSLQYAPEVSTLMAFNAKHDFYEVLLSLQKLHLENGLCYDLCLIVWTFEKYFDRFQEAPLMFNYNEV